jgi:hypothetical protein
VAVLGSPYEPSQGLFIAVDCGEFVAEPGAGLDDPTVRGLCQQADAFVVGGELNLG